MEAIAYGIDFGTTNSGIAVAYEDGSTQVVAAPTSVTPSTVYLHRNRNRLSGPDAVRAYLDTGAASTHCRNCDLVTWTGSGPVTDCLQVAAAGKCQDARLLAQLKADLTSDGFTTTHSWGLDFTLEDLVAVVLRRLKVAADRHTGQDVRRLALGHPVRFSGAEGLEHSRLQGLAKSRLERAAELAGFTEGIVLVEESKAAVALDDVGDGLLVCTDFGGGTFDVAVADVTGHRTDILDLGGVAVGGEEFNAKIVDTFVRPHLGFDREFVMWDGQRRSLPASVRTHLRSLSGLKVLLTSNVALDIASQYRGRGNDEVLDFIEQLLYFGQAYRFYDAIETAKIELSERESTSIKLRSVNLDLDIPVNRSDFERAIQRDLDRVRDCIEDSLEDAGVSAHEVEFVTKTGGSSQLPVFQRMLSELFPEAVIVDSEPFTSVVSGLASYAFEEWGVD